MSKFRPLCIKTDSYKASHYLQFPAGTTKAFYYIEPRIENTAVTMFGLQYIIKEHLLAVPTVEDVEEAAEFWKGHGEPFNREGWLKIVEMGYIPLKIRAVPEGIEMPSKRIMVSVESTGDEFFWVAGWVETLLMHLWYPTTVATRSKQMRKIVNRYLDKTGDPSVLPFKIHDFGYRGCTCQEQAEIGGMAHLATGAMGTDTVAGILCARDYYGPRNGMFAFSIPAAEHSTIGAWLKVNEFDAFRNMIKQFGDGPLFAVVSDTYDLKNAVQNGWCGELRAEVAEMNSVLVVRPDSGEPTEEVVKVAQWLEEGFGATMNAKGYKVLNKVAIIHGDGMNGPAEVEAVYKALTEAGYSADNLAICIGAGLLQRVNRDTFKFAMKCSAVEVNGEWRDVFKSPVDAPWKASKKGRFTVNKCFVEQPLNEVNSSFDLMMTVFENGKLFVDMTFDDVRANSWTPYDTLVDLLKER